MTTSARLTTGRTEEGAERRVRARSSSDDAATGLIQELLRGSSILERADLLTITTVLNAAETFAQLRGVEVRTTVKAIQRRLFLVSSSNGGGTTG